MTTERAGFRRLLGRSTAWSTLNVAVSPAGQFAQGVVVARILAPDDFGVFAVALVVHAVVVNASELGVSAALIRGDRPSARRAAPTVATISLANSVLVAVLMAASTPILSSLLGSPAASGPIAVMALVLPLAGLTAVPSAFLRRDFRMDRIFVADVANMTLTGVVVIILAQAGWGAMALAWSWVAGQLLNTVILMTYRDGRCWPGWDGSEARRLLRFGLPLAGANLLAFAVLNVDYIVVGRVLGAEALGLYVLAFNISGWPMNVFGAVIRSVSLPGFSRLHQGGEFMPDQFTKALRLVAAATVPICLILGALAVPAIHAVYGEEWDRAAAALVGLSVLGAARILLELSADFLVSMGRTRAVFVAQVPWLLALVAALVVLVPEHGIAGAGAAQALVVVGVMVPVYGVLLRRAGVGVGAALAALVPAVVWAVVAAAVAALVAGRFTNNFVACIVGGSAGLAVAAAPYAPAGLRALRRRRDRPAAGGEAEVAEDGDEPVEPPPLVPVELAET